MHTIGLDLHKRESQLCIISKDGSISERRIVTSRERRYSRPLRLQPPMKELLTDE